MHFAFEISNKNLIVAAFSAVNESVWEHLKIMVLPTCIYFLIVYNLFNNDKKKNFWIALFFNIATQMLLVPLVFYSYIAIVGSSILAVDILLFFIAILISNIVSYKIINSDIKYKYESIYRVLVVFVILLFVIFTYVTPKLKLFRDSNTNTYGVFNDY